MHADIYKQLFRNKDSFLNSTGWLESFKEKKPVDSNGDETVWMNYAITRFLKQRLKPDFKLFEYGSGYSTSFYAGLVEKVVSVEYDQEWAKLVKEKIPSNASLIIQGKDVDGKYCRSIKADNELYDVVVIDGRDRVNCVRQSEGSLTSRGVVVLDDSQREEYKKSYEIMNERGYRFVEFEGIKPTGIYYYRTTVFYKDGNCLGI